MPATAQDVAWYRHELGYARIWQGDFLRLLGRFDEAETALRNGLEAHKLLVADQPQVQDNLSRLSWNHKALADLHKSRGARSAAEQAYRDAIAVLEGAGVNDYQGASYDALAELYREEGRIAEAIEAARHGTEAWAKLVAANDAGRRWHLAGSYDRLGALLKQAGQLDLSQEAYGKGGEVWEKLVVEFPDAADYQLHFIWNQSATADLYKARDDRPAAERTYRDAIVVLKNTKMTSEQATLHEALGELYGETGEVANAIEARLSAIEAWKKLAVNNDAGARWHLAGNYEDLGALRERVGDAAGAEAAIVNAGDVWGKLASEFPNAADNHLHLAWQRIRLAELCKRRGDHTAAEQGYRGAAAGLEQAGLSDLALVAAYQALSDLHAEDGRLPEALDARRKAVHGLEKLAAETGDRDHRRHLALARHDLAALLKQTDQPDESLAVYLAAAEVWEGLICENQEALDERFHLALNDRVRSELLAPKDLCQAALLAQQAVALWEVLLEKRVDYWDPWNLALDCQRAARLLALTGEIDDAEAAFRKAVAALDRMTGEGSFAIFIRARRAGVQQALSKLASRQGRADDAEALRRQATAGFREAIAAYEELLLATPKHASALNNLAWLLASSEAAELRNPVRAVDLARRAVDVSPGFLSAWNTLGVAHYRAGDWPAAVEALMKRVSGNDTGADGCDGFFLAMTHWQLGDQAASRKWYDQAVAWMNKNQPDNEELGRFRAEAEALLGVRSSDSADLAGGKVP